MCHIFSGQPQSRTASETRAIRLGGHATSIRLERAFWRILEDVAQRQGVSVPRLLTKIYDEALDIHGAVPNFASLLRCACLTWLEEVKPNLDRTEAVALEAAEDFADPAPPAVPDRVFAEGLATPCGTGLRKTVLMS